METFFQDVRYGLRMLAKSPAFTAIAIITLALGIGANTAIFSMIYAVLLRPLPFHNPGQLVRLYETESAPGQYPFSALDLLDWRAQNHTFQDMSLFGWRQHMNLSHSGDSNDVLGVPTEANFFSLLGVRPVLGRTWTRDEDEANATPVVVLGYGLWRTRFASDRSVIGRSIELNGKAYTVIGIMPPDFHFPFQTQLWTPLPMDSKSLLPRGTHWLNAIGRLKPGITEKEAQAELTVIAKRLQQQYPQSNREVGALVYPLQEDLTGQDRESLLMMLWAVAVVLLIACANVSNLLLSRAVARQKEMAVRTALGASAMRLVRQLLTECVLVSAAGAVAGLLVAAPTVKLITSITNFQMPENPIELNFPVLAFTFVLAMSCGLLFGIVPALQTARGCAFDELKGGGTGAATAGRQRRLISNLLVVCEVGLSLLLLISAGLLLKDFVRLRTTDLGVRADGVLTAAIRLPEGKYQDREKQFSFSQRLLERVRQIPGVESAALTDHLPLEGGNNGTFQVRGRPSPHLNSILVENHDITPEYFHLMGIPLVKGRLLTAEDVAATRTLGERLRLLYAKTNTPPSDQVDDVVFPTVINQAMARTFWPDENPVGQMFAADSDRGPWHQVVGVVADVKQLSLRESPQPEHYDALYRGNWLNLVLHTTVPPRSAVSALRRSLSEVDSSVPMFSVQTMDELIAHHASAEQLLITPIAIFAALALLLAAVGIYGVLSYAVVQRTREIGIRISLGASRREVLNLVLGQGLLLALCGFGLGVAGAIATERVIASSLRIVKPGDPGVFVLAPLCLSVVAFLACYIPARRATKVDPIVALRYE